MKQLMDKLKPEQKLTIREIRGAGTGIRDPSAAPGIGEQRNRGIEIPDPERCSGQYQ